MNIFIVRSKLPVFAITTSVLLLMLTGVVGMKTASGQSQQASSQTQTFSDVLNNHPFSASIRQAREQRFIAGYPDGTFLPDYSISRAEFITMVAASTITNPQGSNCFNDVQDQWFSPFVCAAKARRLVSGYPDGSFRPANNITFAEASAVLSKANRLPRQRLTGPWYRVPIASLEIAKAIPTSIDYIDKKISRAETAEMIWRLKNNRTDKPTKTYASLTAQLPAISSCAELNEKIAAYQYKFNRSRIAVRSMELGIGSCPTCGMPVAPPTVSPSIMTPSVSLQSTSDAAAQYSSTNVQVEGVDEADIVKNDAEYIYMVNRSSVRIIKAHPPSQMAEVSKINFTGTTIGGDQFTPSDLYVDANKLVVIGSYVKRQNMGVPEGVSSGIQGIEQDGFIYAYMPTVKVLVFDITNRRNPTQERTIEFDGAQISSRRIENRLYLVVNHTPDYYSLSGERTPLPRFYDSGTNSAGPVAGCTDVRFLPKYGEMNFLVVASIDLSGPTSEVKKEMIMGSGENMYVSPESLYVAATRYDYPDLERYDIFMPRPLNQKTVVFRFSLENGNVTYQSQGEVDGTVLNQFSMDESVNAFRIAVTTGEVWSTQNSSRNHLFILDKNNLSNILGRLENIAPGERIYSVRFMGKRAYMVTFKKVDPFFVIDVENPANPRILGALKIPGFSDYLHPFDENHIIGFGKDTVDPTELDRAGFNNNDFDFAWYQGMKIALFDVTDVSSPRMMFRELIGDRGTDSEVLQNHKALLYDRTRNLFAFPVTVAEIPNKTQGSYTGSVYGNFVFQGAYVYTLDLQNGFQFRGRITHIDDPQTLGQGYLGDDENIISRIVSIGDYLYTISLGKVKAVNRDSMQEIGSTTLVVDQPSNQTPIRLY